MDEERTTRTGFNARDGVRAGSGIWGLDAILGGGFPALALHFLPEGERNGECVSLSETKEAAFHPAEVELTETTKRIRDQVERLQPAGVVFDSLSEMRLLARDPPRCRRRILERLPAEYGAARRRLQAAKMRGVEPELARHVRAAAEDSRVYLNATPGERLLLTQMLKPLTCLGQRGVVTLPAPAQHGLAGGAVRPAISGMKKRRGLQERTIREFVIGPAGVRAGEPPQEERQALLKAEGHGP